jgi:hypothetical protein
MDVIRIILKTAQTVHNEAGGKAGFNAFVTKKMDGYASSYIASLVNNSMMETMWNNSGRSTSMLEILETQRKYIKSLKEVLKEKVEKTGKNSANTN